MTAPAERRVGEPVEYERSTSPVDGATAPPAMEESPSSEVGPLAGQQVAAAERPRELPAPDIVGLEVLQAHALVRPLGLRVAVSVWETKVGPWGMVLSQVPEPGASMRAGGRIHVVVAGRPHLTVPDVRGEELAEAMATLRRLGITPVVTQARSSRTVSAGRVIGTWPSAGTVVVDGSRVSLTVSRGLLGQGRHADTR